ncbi:hypothetical protein Droror1_Dr00000650 [Drosera rotundifolia]
MGKNEFLTPKAIANRIKAKGLQKLRWYCMSESHQRQMEVFGQNPNRVVDGYSEEFESAFLEHMKWNHRFSTVVATVVYNEYIVDRHHVHMNSTQWATLTEFVKYLGRTGKCKVEETEKGWFMTYIDRDSEALFKEKMKNKRARADIVDEEKQEREIRRQIERAEQLMPEGRERSSERDGEASGLLRSENGGKIVFVLGGGGGTKGEGLKGEGSKVNKVFDDGVGERNEKKGANKFSDGNLVLDDLMR